MMFGPIILHLLRILRSTWRGCLSGCCSHRVKDSFYSNTKLLSWWRTDTLKRRCWMIYLILGRNNSFQFLLEFMLRCIPLGNYKASLIYSFVFVFVYQFVLKLSVVIKWKIWKSSIKDFVYMLCPFYRGS